RNYRASGLHAERRVPGKREQPGRGRRQRRGGRHLHRGDESPPRRREPRGERPVSVGPERRGHRRVAILPEAGLLAEGQRPAPDAGRQGPGRQQAGSDPPRPDPGSLSSEDDPTHAVRVLAGTSDKPRGPDLGTGLRRAGKGGGPLSPSVPPDESDAHRDDSDRGKGPSVRREAEEGGRFERLVPVADEVRGPDRRRAVVGLGPGIVPRDRSEEGNGE